MILLSAALAALAAWLWVHPTAVARLRRDRPSVDPLGRIRALRASRTGVDARVTAVTALAAELRAGLSPDRALVAALGPVWPRTRAVASWGGDVVVALRAECDPVAAHLAACWQVGITTGAPLADIVERLARAERDAADARVELRSALAGPTATAQMLALLPILGLGLGYMLGADPLTWFVTDPLGIPVLLAGALLTGAGVLWTRRITGRVETAL